MLFAQVLWRKKAPILTIFDVSIFIPPLPDTAVSASFLANLNGPVKIVLNETTKALYYFQSIKSPPSTFQEANQINATGGATC
jgi:hypothetical protein